MTSIAAIITQDPVANLQLRAVRALALPDWCIAAGFVRNRVWDHLHGIVPARERVDIDVLFDASDLGNAPDYCPPLFMSHTQRFSVERDFFIDSRTGGLPELDAPGNLSSIVDQPQRAMALSDDDLLFPFEFYLTGTPISLQASAVSRERWKNEVKAAARQRLNETVEWTYLDEAPVALTIYYFPTTPAVGDIDNIVKPIMDALTGVAYLDDQVVERVVAQRFEPGAGWAFAEPSERLAAALNTIAASDNPMPLVYVRADNDLSWRRL